jgi:hypothetical protein
MVNGLSGMTGFLVLKYAELDFDTVYDNVITLQLAIMGQTVADKTWKLKIATPKSVQVSILIYVYIV